VRTEEGNYSFVFRKMFFFCHNEVRFGSCVDARLRSAFEWQRNNESQRYKYANEWPPPSFSLSLSLSLSLSIPLSLCHSADGIILLLVVKQSRVCFFVSSSEKCVWMLNTTTVVIIHCSKRTGRFKKYIITTFCLDHLSKSNICLMIDYLDRVVIL
jgi:hypothetical protein